MDKLEYSEQECRLKSCKILVYISLGQFTTNTTESKQERIDNMICNNNLLFECGAFNIFYQRLQQACINRLAN